MLKDILKNDLTHLRVHFYKLDRLLQIYVPEVAEHIKSLKIDAGHYSAPWFLTLFTNFYFDGSYSDLIYEIWDIILAESWKGFYKIVLAMFMHFKKDILDMKFD